MWIEKKIQTKIIKIKLEKKKKRKKFESIPRKCDFLRNSRDCTG